MPIGNALAAIRSFRPFPPIITSDGNISWTLNVPNFNYLITATNDPTTFGATPLPAGLAVNTTTGAITGTPTTVNLAGTNVTISATNKTGAGTKSLIIKILPPPPVITSTLTLNGFTRTALTYNIVATNMLAGYGGSYGASNLPAGLTINTTTGVINGTPTNTGVTNVTISAINAGGNDVETLVMTIRVPAPVITQPQNFTQAVNTSFSHQIVATNSPTSYSATGLPTGVTINTSSGLITGTLPNLTTNQTFTVTINASNDTGAGTPRTFSITVVASPVITASNFGGNVETLIRSSAATATNGPVTWSISNIPTFLIGASISNGGVITGTGQNSTVEQNAAITITATNIAGSTSVNVTVFLFVPPPPPTAVTRITNSNISLTRTSGRSYSQQLVTNARDPILTFTKTNDANWPPGFTLSSSGLISGTFRTFGNWTLSVRVTNASTAGGSANWIRVVGCAPNSQNDIPIDT